MIEPATAPLSRIRDARRARRAAKSGRIRAGGARGLPGVALLATIVVGGVAFVPAGGTGAAAPPSKAPTAGGVVDHHAGNHPARRSVSFGYGQNGELRTTVPGGAAWSVTPVALGRGDMEPLGHAAAARARGRRSYAFSALAVWYQTTARGTEQGFTIARRPPGSGSTVAIDMAASGSMTAVPTSSTSLSLDLRGTPSGLSYGGLRVTDATGRVLAADLTAHGHDVEISFDDRGAVYPVTVDPWIALSSLAVPATTSAFGTAVALSGDGDTAIVGDPGGGPRGTGEATVYHDVNGTWTGGTALAVPASASQFGTSVALSSDGTTALVGDPAASGGGAATVFTLTDGVWSSGTALPAPSGAVAFGSAVALSGDGNTALVGDPSDGTGVATAYTFDGTSWSSATPLPEPDDSAQYGTAVALSSDGTVAAVGDPQGDVNGDGAVTVLGLSGSTWSVTASLTVPATAAVFGSAVALSSDASTVLVGDPGGGVEGGGTATIFTYKSSTASWSDGTALSLPSKVQDFGNSVAVSSNGQAALVGDPLGGTGMGAVRAYTYSGSAWVAKTVTTPSGASEFGSSVSLSSSGTTALVGDPSATAGGSDDSGAAFTATYSGTAWSTPAPFMAPQVAAAFGTAVSMSSDGSTALVGDPAGGTGTGAATVYSRTGQVWAGGTSLLAPAKTGTFGTSVALSADGTTAIVGDPMGGPSGTGAASVYTFNGTAWTAATALAPASKAGAYGTWVALSASGTTAIVGDPTGGPSGKGAADVFSFNGTAWSSGTLLSPPGGASAFGTAVALSSSGTTAIVGDPGGGTGSGAASVYTFNGTAWSTGSLLSPPAGASAFGSSVSLSASGDLALVGDPSGGTGSGAASVYTFNGTAWSVGAPLAVPSGTSSFGTAVAMSPDGTAALVGDPSAVASGGTAATGDAYPYYLDGPVWSMGTPLVTPASASLFGSAVALSTGGAYGLVGDPGGATGATDAYTSVGTPTKLVITSAPVTGTAASSATLGPVTVQVEDPLGDPVTVTSATTVNLSSTSSGATFSATSGGAPAGSVTIPAGASSASFFYGDTAAGTPTITAQSPGVARASQQATITPGPAAQLEITSAPASVAVGSSFPFTVTAADQFGNPTTEFTDPVQFSSSDAAAVLPADYQFLASDDGSRSFSATLNSAGTQTLSVVDTDDPSMATSTSVTVSPAATSLTAAVDPTSAVFGQSVTYSAVVTPAAGSQAATGKVTFTVGGTALCTTGPLSGNAASCTSASAPVGPDTVTATYSGDTNYSGSTGTISLKVSTRPTTTTASVSPDSVAFGTSTTYTATVTSAAGAPTGTVSFAIGSTSLCTDVALSGGTASCTSAAAPVGPDTVTATYSGDTDDSGSTATATLTVSRAPTTTAVSVNPSSVTLGGTVVYSATVTSTAGTPTGTMSFAAGSTSLCTNVDLSGGTASCTSAAAPLGSDSVVATYSGDGNFAPSVSAGPVSLDVTPPPPAVTTTSLPGATVGVPYSATLDVSGGEAPYQWSVTGSLPAGLALDASTGAITGTPQAAGTASFTAEVTDSEPVSATASLSITVAPGTSTVAAAVTPATTTFGQSVTYSATVNGGGATPSGTVSFTAGTTSLCSGTLHGGSASCQASSAPTGNYEVTATYGGDANYSGSSGTAEISIGAAVITHGYWLVAGDGGIFNFGSARFFGSTGSLHLQRPVVGMTPTADDAGYWMVATDGGMFAFGDARYYGSIPGLGLAPAGSGAAKELAAPIVAMVASPTGKGYLMVASDGGVFAFGDALFHGSCPGIGGCNGSVVAVVPDAGELGYWVVTSTGHVYAFGNAASVATGEPGATSAPITGATASADGKGYLIVDAGGQVFAYGDAPKSLKGTKVAADDIVSIVPTSTGDGYWLMGADGSVYPYGDAPSDGSMAGKSLNAPIVTAAGF